MNWLQHLTKNFKTKEETEKSTVEPVVTEEPLQGALPEDTPPVEQELVVGEMAEYQGNLKLTTEQQMILAQKIAEYWKTKEINDHFKRHWNLSISSSVILKYTRSPQWKPVIEKMRDEYTKGLMEVPVANKKKRLEEYQDIYDLVKEKKQVKMQIEVLRESRAEMEGDKKIMQGNVFIGQMNNYSPEEIAEERMKIMLELESIRKKKNLKEIVNAA